MARSRRIGRAGAVVCLGRCGDGDDQPWPERNGSFAAPRRLRPPGPSTRLPRARHFQAARPRAAQAAGRIAKLTANGRYAEAAQAWRNRRRRRKTTSIVRRRIRRSTMPRRTRPAQLEGRTRSSSSAFCRAKGARPMNWNSAPARQALDKAVETGDAGLLGDVSRRFFHTQAGYQATYLLGLYDFDHDRPLAGGLAFDRLRETAAAEQFEPSLSLMSASCWLRSGMPDRAHQRSCSFARCPPSNKPAAGPP